jgi:hypothetical protein
VIPGVFLRDTVTFPRLSRRILRDPVAGIFDLGRPYLRILAAHCRNSFTDAFRLKRIDYETYKLGYNSSLTMIQASPDGSKAKGFDWFERNVIFN